MHHEHRYKLSMTKKEFLPVNPEIYEESDLYKMVEYAYHVCSCGDTFKTEVREQKANSQDY